MFYQSYECPQCKGVFNHIHYKLSSKEVSPPPNICPLCSANVGSKKTRRRVPKAKEYIPSSGEKMAYARRINKSGDQVYRQMEASSEYRMDQAASMLGVDKSTLAHMKTTNMKDNVKAGEDSYIPPSRTPVSAPAGQEVKMAFTNGPQIQSHFGATNQMPGLPSPEMKKTMDLTFANHQNRVQATVAAGIRK